ncbi:MAG: CCXG family PEP-CTERM protein [Burkholderiales bacterium]|nr:CCXG family PEP-CTERM protein [Burkholderiales bacterium]
MFKTKLLAGVVLAAMAVPASASVITFHSRHSTAGFQATGDDYKNLVEAALGTGATAGYCDASLAAFQSVSNQTACAGGSNSNLAKAFYVDFGVTGSQGADFSLRIAPDFGHGGAVFLDGQLLGFKSDNLWWNLSWASTGEIFQFDHLALDAGNHHLAIYGLEDLAEGPQDAQFRIGTAAWTTFASTDGLVGQVPEPASGGLALLALAGAAGLRRRPTA